MCQQCPVRPRTGYRHVDTAQAYGNEEYVGDGIVRADVDREEFFLATKIHDMFEGPGFDRFHEAAENRLDALGVDALDLLYIHLPMGSFDTETTVSELDSETTRRSSRSRAASTSALEA